MSDTGAPWNLPYPVATDLVRDGAQAIQDLAEATADSLGLVAVKHALFTDIQSQSLAGNTNVAVTNLSITHTLSDASNLLVLMTSLGVVAHSQNVSQVGVAIADDGTLIGIGDGLNLRTRLSAGGQSQGTANAINVATLSFQFVYAPGDTASHTYTTRAINVDSGTRTVFINRTNADDDNANRPRGASSLILMEVKP
jgi:hypothetical protein